MAYPYNGYKKKSFTPNPNQEKAVDKWKNWEYGKIKVTVSPKTKGNLKDPEPSYVINLYNLDEQDVTDIITRLTSLPNKKTVTAWANKMDPTNLSIKVHAADADGWLDGGDLNSIQSVLYKSGKYDTNEVAHIEDQIATGFDTNDTEANRDIANDSQETAMQMWQEYLSKINDPKTLSQLQLYKRMYKKIGVYGILLSIKNVDMIRTRMPDATFVTTKSNWENLFGRGIKRGAKKLPYWSFIPTTKNTSSEFNDAQQQTNWDGTAKSDLGVQVTRGIDKMASADKSGFFKVSVGYDVRDTYLLDGAKEDKFTSQEGLLNNLTGELNQKAKDREALLAQGSQQQTIDGRDEMDKRTEMAVDYMSNNAQDMGITAKKTGDNNNDLADMVYEYCLKRTASKAGILAPQNAAVYAENSTKVALILTNLAIPALQKYNQTYIYSKKEAAGIMSIVYSLVTQLEKNTSLNEGVLGWLKDKATFIKAFLRTLKQIGCKVVDSKPEDMNANMDTPETIKENFYSIFNKINADIF